MEGHIRDQQGEALIGATVQILGSVIGTTADVNGAYEIEVPPGEISILFTYLGYRNLDTTITVQNADRSIELNVNMQESLGRDLPELIVFGSRAVGQSQALRIQQSALNTQTIVHSELFNKYPDITIAETVSRLPGVSIIRGLGEGQIVQVRGLPEQYTAVALNGQRLPTIQPEADQTGTLGLIQSNLVEEVRVIKSRTADMDGDAIGGTVDFRVRQPERRFEFLAQAGIGQNFGFDNNPDQRTGVTQLTGVLNSEVADEKVYALVAGSYFRHGRGTQQQLFDYRQDGTLFAARPNNTNRITENRGLVGAVELRPSIYNRLRISYNFAKSTEDIIHRQLFLEDRADPFVADLNNTRTSSWRKERQLELVVLEAENNFPSTRVDYKLSFSQTREDLVDRLGSIYVGGQDRGSLVASQQVLAAALPGERLGTAERFAARGTQENINLEEDVALLNLNITRYLNRAKTSFLKIGGRYRTRDRLYGSFAEAGQLGSNFPGVLAPGEFAPVLGELINDEVPNLQEEGLTYTGRQRIQAYYAMVAANLTSRFSLSAGLRYEQLEVKTSRPGQEEFGFDEGDFLPSLNLTFRTNSATQTRQVRQFRLSLYQAVARVNYATFLTPEPVRLIALDEFTIGNQSINNTTSNNIDLTFERYGRRDGLITIGAYYKSLEDPTLRVSNTDTSDLTFPVYTTQLVNTQAANLIGFELGFYQNLRFLGTTTAWRYVNINGNYNFNILNAASTRFSFEDFTLPQAPRQTANLSVVYNNPNKGLSVVVAANLRDRVFDRVLDERPVYRNTFFSLDVSADYKFYKDFSVYTRLNNLTDHPFREYFGQPTSAGALLRSEARYGTWGVIGVRYQPGPTKVAKGGETL